MKIITFLRSITTVQINTQLRKINCDLLFNFVRKNKDCGMPQRGSFHSVLLHLFSRTLQLVTKRESKLTFLYPKSTKSIARILVSRGYICYWGNFVAILPLSKCIKEKMWKKKENFRNIGSLFILVTNFAGWKWARPPSFSSSF